MTRARAASGAATRKTAWTPSITSPRTTPARPPPDASETVDPAWVANTAPRIAAPTAPPSPRKKPVTAIAIPSSRRSTVFWTAVISTWVTMPKPSPNTTSPAAIVSAWGSAASPDSRARATVIKARPAIGNRL
jgi:hypothetical protein